MTPEVQTSLEELRRAGRDPAAIRSPGLLRAWAAAERLVAYEQRERARVRRDVRRGTAGGDAPGALRDFLAARVAEVKATAEVTGTTWHFADAGGALANCDTIERLVGTWDVLVSWVEDPDAEPAEAYRLAAAGIHRAMWRLALLFAEHPGFDPAWRPAR